MSKIKILDLFSGIGGFSLGLHNASDRFETVAFAEQDEFCKSVLSKNYPDIKIYDDVKEIETIDCDLITAGFPCPAFSSSGRRGGFEQDNLFYEVIRIAKINKPKFIIFENVKGFAHSTKTWRETLINEVSNIGYETQDFIFDGRDFGILQCRARYFAICSRDGLLFNQQFVSTHGKETKNISTLLTNPNALRRWETPPASTKQEWVEVYNVSKPSGIFNGVSSRLDGRRKAALGNSVIPIILTSIGKTLINYA
tara:strand:+ start:3943 stop:4704 length:762 start_codon:yes stop_codon:yes gene_type:complete